MYVFSVNQLSSMPASATSSFSFFLFFSFFFLFFISIHFLACMNEINELISVTDYFTFWVLPFFILDFGRLNDV